MEIDFVKMSGSGNDFIVVDDRSGALSGVDKNALARLLCRRKVSVGADGMIFIEPSDAADFRMHYINADGSDAGMCGNGARCAAKVATLWGVKSPMLIETGAGIIEASVSGDDVCVQMPRGELVEKDIELVVDHLPIVVDLYDTGVPHAVAFVDELEGIPVEHWGRAIRYHRHFAPGGANADFVRVVDEHTIMVRTYERGVEAETLACGTGAVAAALDAARRGLVTMPVNVVVRLPDTLTVNADGSKITLSGKVKLAFRGKAFVSEEEICAL